jgi:hypothetical protein
MDGRLAKREWTHAAHLAMGLWHVERHGAAQALALLRSRIRRLNERHGTINSATSGYHETITAAYVTVLARFSVSCGADLTLGEKAVRLLAGDLARHDLLLACYSRDRLMSPVARAEWIEPDLAPLESLVPLASLG